jgi:oligosaccharide repeat unit polymerase
LDKKKLVTPGFIFMLVWLVSCISMIFFINDKRVNKMTNIAGDFNDLALYVFFFISVSFVSFLFARLKYNNSNRFKTVPKFNDYEYAGEIFRHYRFILYLNLFLAIFKFIYIMLTYHPINYYDYRMTVVNFLPTMTMFSLVGFLYRLGYWTQVISSFLVSLLGIKHGNTKFNMKETILYLVLYSSISLADGARLFILQFFIFYFVPYYLLYLRRTNKLYGGELKKFFLFVVLLFSLVGLIGILRSDPNNRYNGSINNSFADKFYYNMNGLAYTNRALSVINFSVKELDLGSNFFKKIIISNQQTFKEKIHKKLPYGYEFMVQTIIVFIFFDFGYFGSLVFWGLLCFIIETIALKMYDNLSIINILSILILCRFTYGTNMGNPFPYMFSLLEFMILAYFFKPFILQKIQKRKINSLL